MKVQILAVLCWFSSSCNRSCRLEELSQSAEQDGQRRESYSIPTRQGSWPQPEAKQASRSAHGCKSSTQLSDLDFLPRCRDIGNRRGYAKIEGFKFKGSELLVRHIIDSSPSLTARVVFVRDSIFLCL